MNPLVSYSLTLCTVLGFAIGPANGQNSSTSSAPCNSSPHCSNLALQNASILRRQFLDLRSLKGAFVIKFHLVFKFEAAGSGDEEGDHEGRLPKQEDAFNPRVWMWMSTYGTYAIDLPLDYRFVSLGLLGLKEYDLKVVLTGDKGCISSVTPACWDEALFKLLGDLVWPMHQLGLMRYGEHIPKEHLCRSVYALPSFISGHDLKSVGWKCCSFEDKSLNKCSTGSIIKKPNPDHQRTLFAFVFLLAIGLYTLTHGASRAKLVWYAWKGKSWDWVGDYFGFGPTTYRTYILDIGPGDLKRWVHVSDEHLVQGENRVSLPELWQLFGGPFHSSRCIVIFKFIIILLMYVGVAVIAVPIVYGMESNTLDLLRDGEEIALNLRSLPLAWWRTNEQFWPRNFGILLLAGFFFVLILELILVLIFVIGFRRGPPKDFQRYLREPSRKRRKPPKSTSRPVSVLLSILFLVLDVILGFITVAAVMYPIVQVIVHVCLAVIIYIDTLAPWVIAVAMTLFHIHLNFKQFRQPYIDIKELLHAEFLNSKEAIHAYTVWNIHANTPVRAFKSETDEEDSKSKDSPVIPIQKLPPRMLRTLLVTFQQDGRPTILIEHFLKVSRHLVSNQRAVWGFIVRLVLFLTYLGVIMSSVTLYRASPAGGGADRSTEGLVTGMVVFVFLLLPHASVASRRKYKSSTCRLLWKLEIERFMRSLETEWDGQFDSPEAKLRATFNRKRRREQWSVILADDDVNQDPPLQFPDKISEGGTSMQYNPTSAPDANGWSPQHILHTTSLDPAGTSEWNSNSTTSGIAAGMGSSSSGLGPEIGSMTSLTEEVPVVQRLRGSTSNMSVMSSTTT